MIVNHRKSPVPLCALALVFALEAGGPVGAATEDAGGASAVPSAAELAAATYQGFDESPLTLTDGHWEGEPADEGAASVPRVDLAPGFRVTGDLDGDGDAEAVALLYYNFGGSGVFSYLAVLARDPQGGVDNLATTEIGDRIQLRTAVIDAGTLTIETVETGPDDGACCPGQMRRRMFALEDSQLVERSNQDLGRLDLSALEGVTWRLVQWTPEEPAADDIVIDLAFDGDRMGGSSGCNRYQGGITSGEMPGDFTVSGPLAGTAMACPPPIDEAETRYLTALQKASRFRFQAGRLMIDWNDDESWGVLAFQAAD